MRFSDYSRIFPVSPLAPTLVAVVGMTPRALYLIPNRITRGGTQQDERKTHTHAHTTGKRAVRELLGCTKQRERERTMDKTRVLSSLRTYRQTQRSKGKVYSRETVVWNQDQHKDYFCCQIVSNRNDAGVDGQYTQNNIYVQLELYSKNCQIIRTLFFLANK